MPDSDYTRPSLVEYVGLTMIVAMLLLGVAAAALPESVLEPVLRAVLRLAGAN